MAESRIPPTPPLTTKAATPVEIASSSEPWSEYRLMDGTVIRARLRVHTFRRWLGHYDLRGVPVYSQECLIDFDVRAQPEMMEP